MTSPLEAQATIINIVNFEHPHVKSILGERLWGFRDRGVNKERWLALVTGQEILVYGGFRGVKGIWLSAMLAEKFEDPSPSQYWLKDPKGFPLRIKLDFQGFRTLKDLQRIKPALKEELANYIPYMRTRQDHWALINFGDREKEGITYPLESFLKVKQLYEAKNEAISGGLTHQNLKEMIHRIGLLQAKWSEKEYLLEDFKIDVAWKRTAKSVPEKAFEIQLGGNIYEALSKLKHAYDIWNAIPILVTSRNQVPKASRLLEGSFHEIKDSLRIVEDAKVKELYEHKEKLKQLETLLGIL